MEEIDLTELEAGSMEVEIASNWIIRLNLISRPPSIFPTMSVGEAVSFLSCLRKSTRLRCLIPIKVGRIDLHARPTRLGEIFTSIRTDPSPRGGLKTTLLWRKSLGNRFLANALISRN